MKNKDFSYPRNTKRQLLKRNKILTKALVAALLLAGGILLHDLFEPSVIKEIEKDTYVSNPKKYPEIPRYTFAELIRNGEYDDGTVFEDGMLVQQIEYLTDDMIEVELIRYEKGTDFKVIARMGVSKVHPFKEGDKVWVLGEMIRKNWDDKENFMVFYAEDITCNPSVNFVLPEKG